MSLLPPATVQVSVGQARQPSVTSLSYGTRTIKSASDLSLVGAQDGYAIIYESATNSFKIGPASGVTIAIDNGTY
jgi:hypothetical protein